MSAAGSTPSPASGPAEGQPAACPAGVEHGLSIDVEDYRQILSLRFRGQCGPATAEFERNMDAVLGHLAAARARATLFVTGTVARDHPALVRRWAAMGHEIACHGYDHTPIWAMSAAALRDDLQRARRTIEDATGRSVAGYRAPVFSIRWDTLWALDLVRQAGFTYDSSIVPVRTRRYGLDGFDPRPRLYALPGGGDLVEIPLGTGRWLWRQVPMGGGGYFRLFSYRLVRRAVTRAQAAGRPFVVYCHPDEFGHQPFRAADLATGWRQKAAATIIAMRSNLGRRKVPRTLGRLLSEFRFVPLGALAERTRAAGETVRLPPAQ